MVALVFFFPGSIRRYGACGTAAGISPNVLLRAAGWAQSRAGTSDSGFGKWWGDVPFGDDPQDQEWIKAGIEYAKSFGY
ncbi:polymorphic toxin type 44 domain-containing protein [Pseudomonas sp. B21-035]|uniref:polymorphic toxin type 44 domain-containing protein n=1 Tax=Pseudomonas sp. B21-035 TaxID=2895484 RepID=UPI00216017B9|nr:polymorphic toxin type 44 domain-containing protein [Pseudomonas sp. B21-035]UVL56947.1 polymorphic toxin type 44 domain-containing protein [Pseudomonas sp. B21-035]